MTKETERVYGEYKRLGMSEEQIDKIKKIDDVAKKSDRGYYCSAVRLDDVKNELCWRNWIYE